MMAHLARKASGCGIDKNNQCGDPDLVSHFRCEFVTLDHFDSHALSRPKLLSDAPADPVI
jgi:hypothetical protein